jgi:TolA-binding protein
VEDARGSSRFASALETWLKAHPHGPQAARALIEEAALQENLLEAGGTLRRARGEAENTPWGSQAALELAKLDYAQERTESALLTLEDAETWPRAEALEPDWLFWRGQCRLLLKGYEQAKADFERLIAGYPKYPQLDAARLGLAECDAALRADERALAGFEALYKDPQNPFAAQALWGAASLRQRQGEAAESKRLFEQLRGLYPSSFEAKAAQGHLDELAKLPTPTPVPQQAAQGKAGRFRVQVGAFSKRAGALRLQRTLKARRYPVQLQARRLGARTLYIVRVGPYKTRAAAEAAAQHLEKRERLPQRITED